jgi:hypothetical protein
LPPKRGQCFDVVVQRVAGVMDYSVAKRLHTVARDKRIPNSPWAKS